MFLARIVTSGSNIELQQNTRACPIVLHSSKITTKHWKNKCMYMEIIYICGRRNNIVICQFGNWMEICRHIYMQKSNILLDLFAKQLHIHDTCVLVWWSFVLEFNSQNI
jgi:hypothetical protein